MLIKAEPKPKRRPRFTKNGRTYNDLKQIQAQQELMYLLRQYVPKNPATGAVSLTIDYYMSQTKTELSQKLKSKQREFGILKHVKKPDIDNLEKQVLDCMTKLRFWKDDGQVFKVCHEKHYDDGKGARIEILLEEVE